MSEKEEGPNKLSRLGISTISKFSKAKRQKLGVAWADNNPALLRGGPNRRKPRRDTAIPRLRFRKLVEEIASEFRSDLRFHTDGVEALQQAAETYLADRFRRCSQLATLCKLDTVREDHWRFVENDADTTTVGTGA